MNKPMTGIHHITAIASDPQRNLDFYTRVLGLRLVKRTVNFDDPGTYHFYFGSASGAPGTILTFFPWVEINGGKRGLGQLVTVAFSIPAGSIAYWQERLNELGITTSSPFTRFDEEVLTLVDPDGLQIELIASETASAQPGWDEGGVPANAAIRGFSAPTLMPVGGERTAHLLSEILGLAPMQSTGTRTRYSLGPGVGESLDIEIRPNEQPGRLGAGVVHHIAMRARDEEDQLAWREVLLKQGFNVTPVLDRQYFRSIYFREPGGILFELATDGPGFMIDEPYESLGSALKLPPWLEPTRSDIERVLVVVKS